MAMVLVWDMLDLDMDILVLDILDMAITVSAILVLATMARDLLMLVVIMVDTEKLAHGELTLELLEGPLLLPPPLLEGI